MRLCLILKLFIMDLSFKHKKDIVFVLLQNASPLGEKNITLIMIIQCVEPDIFKVLVFFNIVTIRGMIITQQLPFILQHCLKMEWDWHKLLSIMEQMINQERQLNKFLVIIINLLIVRNQTIPIKWMKVYLTRGDSWSYKYLFLMLSTYYISNQYIISHNNILFCNPIKCFFIFSHNTYCYVEQ